jgi:hypothetical protein
MFVFPQINVEIIKCTLNGAQLMDESNAYRALWAALHDVIAPERGLMPIANITYKRPSW